MFEALTPFGIKWGTFVCYSLKETATRQKQAGSSPAFNYNSKLYVLKSIQSLAKAINPLMVFHILPRLQTCMNITGILIGVESNTVVRLRFHTMWSLSCFRLPNSNFKPCVIFSLLVHQRKARKCKIGFTWIFLHCNFKWKKSKCQISFLVAQQKHFLSHHVAKLKTLQTNLILNYTLIFLNYCA